MKYHKFRFGLWKNLKVLLCKIVGHRINDDPSNHWCERCGLAYSECYFPIPYWSESKITSRKQIMDHGLGFPKTEEELEWFDEAHKDFEHKLDGSEIDVEKIINP